MTTYTAGDLDRLTALARDVGVSQLVMAQTFSRAARSLNRLSVALRDVCNTPQAVAGLEGRYMVRAGLDPAYRSPDAVDALVREILDGTGGDDRLVFLTAGNRARVAAAVLRGWVGSHLDAVCGCGRDWSPRCPVDRHRAYSAALAS